MKHYYKVVWEPVNSPHYPPQPIETIFESENKQDCYDYIEKEARFIYSGAWGDMFIKEIKEALEVVPRLVNKEKIEL